ncbi:Platelet-activating factor acetylhydrolase, isoform II [Singulisphaera sp. GP187]|uniref:alpha/beta hydrolase family protein n=1 Tax=Singulisphaera sp. GP187 TaxID=1882752 RepID=UPI00092A8C1E|nr:hypothetical protein [Singulisphaera sp. GP187]SIO35308.1 Platelet-activating factor acetylhydrolase, isoform II [Singulisphaera sp. GP187]
MNHLPLRPRPRRAGNFSVESLESRSLLSSGLRAPLAAPNLMPASEVEVASAKTIPIAEARNQATSPLVLPRPSGPHPVGQTSIEVVDPARPDPFSAAPNAQRDLMVTLWYPAGRMRPGTPRAPYVPNVDAFAPFVTADLNEGSDPTLSVDDVRQMLTSIRTHAWIGAPVSPRQQAYPVIVLLPGRGSTPEFYTAYAEDLASRGYVVAGVNPTGVSDVTAFPDGRVVPSRLPDIETLPFDRLVTESVLETEIVAADARTVLDQLERMNAGAVPSPLRGRLDLLHVAVVGHSLGGAAAAQLVATDPRFRTGADLDGTLWGPVQTAGVGKPFLFLAASDPTSQQLKQSGLNRRLYQQMVDQAALDTAGIAATIRAGGYRVVFDGFHHSSFTDLELQRSASPDGPAGSKGIQAVETYLTEFLNMTLFGRQSPLFNRTARPYRGVWFSTPTT